MSVLPATDNPFLELPDLAVIEAPLGEARGLPNQAYTSDAYLGLECDRMWARSWVAIGRASQVPEAGDVRPVDVLGMPLFFVRARDGAVNVFHNVCRHRGMTLVTEAGHAGAVLTCPYHNWAYGFDGALRTTPHVGGSGIHTCPGFDSGKFGLKQVRSAVWFDQIFVNLSGDGASFDDFIRPLAERWSMFDQSLIRHGGADSVIGFDLDCNWKLAVENYCEAYHLPMVHPGLNSYSRLEDHYDIVVDGRFAGQGSLVYSPERSGPALPVFPDLPEEWATRAEYVALFPNILLGIHFDHFYAVRLLPGGAGRVSETFDIYYVGEAPLGPDYDDVRRQVTAGWNEIFAEDQSVCEGMQAGRASPGFDGGILTPVMEQPTHCFHRWAARAMHV